LAVTIAASLAATSVLGLRIGRRVAEIQRDIHRVQHDPQARIRLSGKGDEFDRIGGAFNGLLDRLAETMDRVRQVTLDIAHDLRTPSRVPAIASRQYEVISEQLRTRS
jgi:signal transduction histidine kinase